MYVYRYFKEAGVYTVGFYDPQGRWIPQSDHEYQADAEAKVHYLNGGDLNDISLWGMAKNTMG